MDHLLDNRTQTVVQVAVSVVLCLVMFIAWRTQKTYPGFGRWTVSKIPYALAFLLIGLRGVIPDWASIFVANILLFTSPLLLYEGIRQFLGKPHRDTLHYWFMGLLISGIIVFLWVAPSVNARVLIVSGLSAIVLARCAWSLFTSIPRALRPTYWCTASMFAVASLVLLLRVCTAGTLPQLANPFIADCWQSLTFLVAIAMPIGWTFGFFMMTNNRLTLELMLAETELRQLAATDDLTGALNRQPFIEMALHEMARVQRDGAPLTLLMLDIDHFKGVNDLHGHQIGDALLRAVTDTCRAHLRTVDLLARWGGEEFAILLPDTDLAGSRHVAERLRAVVSTLTIPAATAAAHATVSIGCAAYTPDEDFDAALHRADLALYQAKAQGRNRVVAYGVDLLNTEVYD
jgi:diguanylate cyclase (GGDEF)-like protein